MLQLVWGLFVLLLLAGACAVLASGGKIHAALLPLPLLAGSAVLLYGFGIVGALRVGVALVILLLAAVWVVGLVKLRPAGFAKACREALATPGLVLFLGGAAFFWVLFFVQQPMFTQWDEFTAWGLAPKMVVERGAFYVADPVNLKASFTYPATSLVTFLFQPFGVWSEWACLAALDTLALACVAAATALPRDRWYSGVLVFAAGVLLPYFFRDPTPGAYATQYVNAMADLPMAMLFGGTLCLYLGTQRRRGIFWLTALPLALLTLTKDICFAYGLIAAFLIGLDWLARAEGPFRKRLVPALLHAGGLAVVVVAAFLSWSRYTAAVTPTADTAASVGSAGLSYGAVLTGGIKQLLGIGRDNKFAQIMAAMGDAFFTRRICLLGGGALAVLAITLVAAAAWLAAEKGPARRGILVMHLGFAFCFAALYAFHLILYYYNFSDVEGLALKDYDRYLTPYYQAWMLTMLCQLAMAARGKLGRTALGGAAAVIVAVFCWRGVPAAGFWTGADSLYTLRADVEQRAETMNTVLNWGDRVLALSQGDDATRWYYYRYELTAQVVNGFGGFYGRLGETEDRWDSDFMNLVESENWTLYDYKAVCVPDTLVAYMAEKDCDYLLIDRADDYLQREFSPLFEGGLTNDMPATLYHFEGEDAEVPFTVAAVAESEVQ
ncbi:hypothetical protein [Subdoligranulum variabile]|uniref:hypothetical protein n=1 Tax=Subdoligranulum variabile TaxID=214851 RepID=UPI0026EAF52D|nr:hypothetical protein [Subdoligranulum variabile]